MIESVWTAMGTALWLGLLTSISPCPLAANIAAISYIGREVGTPRATIWRGLAYTAGRTLMYVILSALLVSTALAVPDVALFLQYELNKIMGPLLVVVALILLRVVRLPGSSRTALAVRLQNRVKVSGVLGAGALGLVFALSFCPISAALFFGTLVPLSLERGSAILLPLLYGIGTAIPVVVFASLLTLGVHHVGRAYDALMTFERWARPVTGVIFLLVGLYFCREYLL